MSHMDTRLRPHTTTTTTVDTNSTIVDTTTQGTTNTITIDEDAITISSITSKGTMINYTTNLVENLINTLLTFGECFDNRHHISSNRLIKK